MAEESVSLFEVGNGCATLTLDETEYTLRPLTIGDIAKVQSYMRDQRMQAFLKMSRSTFPMPEETRAAALAAIACKPIAITDVYGDVEAEAYMLFLALHKDDRSINHKYVLDKIPPMSRGLLSEVLLYISNLKTPESTAEKQGTDPTDKIDESSCQTSDGTSSSPTSATTSS